MFSSSGTEFKTFKQFTRERLLHEMIRSTKTRDSKPYCKVLIMDEFTTKIMFSTCTQTDIMDEGVSLWEVICNRRQPMPCMDAVYFVQPCKENVNMILSDMGGKVPFYKQAFVFFSSPMTGEIVNHLSKDPTVSHRIITLTEMNLEYCTIDSQGFITGNEGALEELFLEDNSGRGEVCLNAMATRIATIFASLREFPFIRYRSAKSLDAATMTTCWDLLPTKLAAGIWNHLTNYKITIPNFPLKETCELIILDRSVDQISPVIHEWFYDAMCHDLLIMEGNNYVHEVPSKAGGMSEKEKVLLEERDPIWLELRHAHIADVSERLHEKMTNFMAKNDIAKIRCSRGAGEISTHDLQKMNRATPQYIEQIYKLSHHIKIAEKIFKSIEQEGLKQTGKLEQDLVFGYAGMQDLIKFLKQENSTPENKLRLLMIFSAIYPEKLEGENGLKLMELAKLHAEDMKAVNNMRLLRGLLDVQKVSDRTFSLKFNNCKRKHLVMKERTDAEKTWQLSRFYPMLEELIEKLSKGELSENDYPCVNGSSTNEAPSCSVRSRRTPTWAQRRISGHVYPSNSIQGLASSSSLKMGNRIFVFIIGGATRSELRVCHKLTSKLKREIILGSSSLDDPQQFISKLKSLPAHELLSDNL